MSQIINLTNSNFEETINNCKTPVVVDFWAQSCAPCRAIAPLLEELAQKQDKVLITKLDVQNNLETAEKYNIMSIPTLVYFEAGKIKKQIIGADVQAIKDLILSS